MPLVTPTLCDTLQYNILYPIHEHSIHWLPQRPSNDIIPRKTINSDPRLSLTRSALECPTHVRATLITVQWRRIKSRFRRRFDF